MRYVPDQYKTQQMHEKVILENCGTFKSVPDCYKNQEIGNELIITTQKLCDKAADTHPSIIQFVPDCFKTQEMCYKVVHRCIFCIWFYSWRNKILEKYVT